MKTKLLSKLMLITCTAVMFVGCNNEVAKDDEATSKAESDKATELANKNLETKNDTSAIRIDRCEVCNHLDDFIILQKDAVKLITDFHNTILTQNSSIQNAGGYFTLQKPAPEDTVQEFRAFPSFKFHWAIEDTSDNKKRLFITYEPSNIMCDDDDHYEGKYSIEDAKLYSSYPENDILPLAVKGTELTETNTLSKLKNTVYTIRKTHRREVLNGKAKDLLSAFKNNTDVNVLYQCDDIVFDKLKTLYPIGAKSGRDAFVYFFGYDETQVYHRLRLIIAGLDDDNKIIFFDGTKSLLRENSRPRP